MDQTGPDFYHKLGPRIFERRYGIDVRAVVVRLTTKPSIRIEGGVFIGRYLDEEYTLGPVRAGLCAAVRKILSVKREDRTWRSMEGAQPDFEELFRIRNQIRFPRSHDRRLVKDKKQEPVEQERRRRRAGGKQL